MREVLVWILVAALPMQLLAQWGCQKFQSLKGFRLAGFSFHQQVANDVWSCFLQCKQDPEHCQSINYNLATFLCEHNNRTRASRPAQFVSHKDAVYFDNPLRAVLGSTPALYGLSCQEIKLGSPNATSGRYWIDPLVSGKPFTVFCDMSTDGGGWTLLAQTVITSDKRRTTLAKQTDYRQLSNYNNSDSRVDVSAISKLQRGLGFRQLRYYCSRPSRNKTVHLMTTMDRLGYDVVRYFVSDPTNQPEACGSFLRFPDDNSILASNCSKWGDDGNGPECNKWGYFVNNGTYRIYNKPMFWANVSYYSALPPNLLCDEKPSDNNGTFSPGDSWKVYVR